MAVSAELAASLYARYVTGRKGGGQWLWPRAERLRQAPFGNLTARKSYLEALARKDINYVNFTEIPASVAANLHGRSDG